MPLFLIGTSLINGRKPKSLWYLNQEKNPNELSYRPISLIPRIFEKPLLKRLETNLLKWKLIPPHQFEFRRQHGTVKQVHRVVKQISNELEHRRYCAAPFIDISQTFDIVWHTGLYFKMRKTLPRHFYQLLKSYLSNIFFLVRLHMKLIPYQPYLEFLKEVFYVRYYIFYSQPIYRPSVATFADDTAVLASHSSPQVSCRNL